MVPKGVYGAAMCFLFFVFVHRTKKYPFLTESIPSCTRKQNMLLLHVFVHMTKKVPIFDGKYSIVYKEA